MDSLHPLSIESLTSPRKMPRLSVSDFPLSPGPLSAFFPMFPGSDPLSLAIQQLSPLGANLNGSTGSSLNSSGSSFSSLQLSLDSVQPVSPPDSLSSCSRASQNTSTPRLSSVTPSPSPTSSASEASEASPRGDTSSRRDEVQPSSPEIHTAKVLEKLDKCAASVAPGKSSTSNVSSDPKGKPAHSYISLISMAILSSADKKMILCDIYQWIMDNFEYYNNEERAWRNSIRHNLSLNECFIKAGRAENGKGNYWAIHPSCVQDFSKGDYRRRHARRRARNTRSHFNVSSMPYNYRCNLGYVPMTSNAVGYHPYANPMQFLPSATASYPSCAMATPATPSGQPVTTSSVTHPAFYQAAQMVHRGQTRGEHPMAFSGHTASGNTSNMMLGHYGGHAQPATTALPQAPQFPGLNHVAPHTQYTSQGFPALW